MAQTATAANVSALSAAARGGSRWKPPKELKPAKALFNKFLEKQGLPSCDDLEHSDLADPGAIETILFRWAEDMIAHPPTHQNNNGKYLDRTTVGNYFGLVKERLQLLFPDHDDFNTADFWFTKTKAEILKELGQSRVRGGGNEEEPGKVAIVRVRDKQGDEDIPDLLTIQQDLLLSDQSDTRERRLALNLTFGADGRSGEVKYLSYKSFACNPAGDCVDADW